MSHRRPQFCHSQILLTGVFIAIWWLGGDSAAQPFDYHPLELGSQWYYENAIGDWQSMVIVGDETILGSVTRVRRQEEAIQTFENFWTRDQSGNLFLHGARNLTFDFEMAYLPPIRMVDAPLYLGKYWVTEGVELYDLDGNPMGSSIDYALQVYFEGDITVPAGEFYAYGVGEVIDRLEFRNDKGERFDVLGRCLREADPPERDQATEWYADGIGLVQHTYVVPPEAWWQLQWWEQPTPALPMTWGAIKAGYR
jgi:hypothetical protein